MQLTEQHFKMGETSITKEYTDGKLTKIFVQNKDNEVLFSGNTEESTIVLDALKAVLYEEVL